MQSISLDKERRELQFQLDTINNTLPILTDKKAKEVLQDTKYRLIERLQSLDLQTTNGGNTCTRCLKVPAKDDDALCSDCRAGLGLTP